MEGFQGAERDGGEKKKKKAAILVTHSGPIDPHQEKEEWKSRAEETLRGD